MAKKRRQCLDGESDRAAGTLIGGKVDDRVGRHIGGSSGRRVDRRVDLGHKVEPRIVAREGADSRAHAPGGTVNSKSNHGRFPIEALASLSNFCQDTSIGGPIDVQNPPAVVPPSICSDKVTQTGGYSNGKKETRHEEEGRQEKDGQEEDCKKG